MGTRITSLAAGILLALAMLLSAQLALAWAELGSFPVLGDKSSLAGCGGVILVMPMRWTLLAIVLAIGTARGAFSALPGGRGGQLAIVLAIHLALGVGAYLVFEWVTAGIQRGDSGAQAVAVVFGVVLPALVWLIASWGVARGWIARHPLLAGGVLTAAVLCHLAAWRQGLYQDRR